MTESEVWLQLAREYEYCDTMWTAPIGLCAGINRSASYRHRHAMRKRLELFRPPVPAFVEWFWPAVRTKAVRALRATACGFLAAMAEEDEHCPNT